MINKIFLKNFKCFQELDLSINRINILTGCNSSGKSTVIQSLALMKQSFKGGSSEKIIFNGDEVALGSYNDVVNFISNRESISIGLGSSVGECRFTIKEAPERSRVSEVQDMSSTIDSDYFSQIIRNLNRISSERTGPMDVYPIPSGYETGVGSDGRFTPFYMCIKKDQRIDGTNRLITSNNRFISVLNEYIAKFFPNYQVDANEIDGTNVVTLKVLDLKLGKTIKPVHVGFGISNVLPILAAGLGANPGDILIVENPEIHLHPKAQSLLAEFLCKVAADGIQVILETHSDHIVNGIRKSVKNNIIAPELLNTYFFKTSIQSPDVSEQVEYLKIDRDGNYTHWPLDFFDQIEKDFKSLLELDF
jgi:predicted ATPase